MYKNPYKVAVNSQVRDGMLIFYNDKRIGYRRLSALVPWDFPQAKVKAIAAELEKQNLPYYDIGLVTSAGWYRYRKLVIEVPL